jgi:hypothetical protein
MRNIKIYYLHYNTNSAVSKDRPSWFSYESCLKNLLSTILLTDSKLNIILTLVFDGNHQSFLEDFSSRYFDENDVTVINNLTKKVKFISGGTANKASIKLLKIIVKEDTHHKDDLIYILENDYMHTGDWISAVEDIAKSNIEFDYLSLYDHADKYQYTKNYCGNYNSLKSKIFVTSTRHWRTTPSTCFSFLVKAEIFNNDYYFFKIFRDRYIQPFLKLIKRRVMLSPIPGFSTHCMSKYLSPIIDWSNVNDVCENSEHKEPSKSS